MNQFNNYKEQLKKCSTAYDIANKFDTILNSIWCTYSFHQGKKKWREIWSSISEPYRSQIDTEIYHVESGHGREQALMAVKHEMEKYIKHLIKDI